MEKESLKGKKVLVMGLGLHGGGIATTKWLVAQGAKVTATDMRDKKVLASSVAALEGLPVRFVLGKHNEKDFETHDIIVANPAVPRESLFLAIAKKAGKRIVNDVTLFFDTDTHPTIAITGTRGKTTTTLWIATLLKKKWKATLPSGNTPENALLKELSRIAKKDVPVVAELSSWQLEFLPEAKRAPHISVITNIYPDHLNRYGSIEDYARAKAGIFTTQSDGDYILLNADNVWTPFYLKMKPKSMVFLFSIQALKPQQNGMFVKDRYVVFRADGMEQKVVRIDRFAKAKGMHAVSNLLAALLAVKLFAPEIIVTEKDLLALPNPRMRQEEVLSTPALRIINDSCATSPDGVVAAIERFAGEKGAEIFLITGGTNKQLEFRDEAKKLGTLLPADHVIFLEGSATKEVIALLRKGAYKGQYLEEVATLEECVRIAREKILQSKTKKKILLFSPGGSSFEKFLHEFDRGEQFNVLVKKYFRKKASRTPVV